MEVNAVDNRGFWEYNIGLDLSVQLWYVYEIVV